jgi:hypothetical protein
MGEGADESKISVGVPDLLRITEWAAVEMRRLDAGDAAREEGAAVGSPSAVLAARPRPAAFLGGIFLGKGGDGEVCGSGFEA